MYCEKTPSKDVIPDLGPHFSLTCKSSRTSTFPRNMESMDIEFTGSERGLLCWCLRCLLDFGRVFTSHEMGASSQIVCWLTTSLPSI